MSEDNEKTQKLDEAYFKNLAQKVQNIGSDSDKTQILGAAFLLPPNQGEPIPTRREQEYSTKIGGRR